MNYSETFLYLQHWMNELHLMFSVMPSNVSVSTWLSAKEPAIITLEFLQVPHVYKIPDSLMLIDFHVSVKDRVTLSFAFKQ